jgi:hypothetical protein
LHDTVLIHIHALLLIFGLNASEYLFNLLLIILNNFKIIETHLKEQWYQKVNAEILYLLEDKWEMVTSNILLHGDIKHFPLDQHTGELKYVHDSECAISLMNIIIVNKMVDIVIELLVSRLVILIEKIAEGRNSVIV